MPFRRQIKSIREQTKSFRRQTNQFRFGENETVSQKVAVFSDFLLFLHFVEVAGEAGDETEVHHLAFDHLPIGAAVHDAPVAEEGFVVLEDEILVAAAYLVADDLVAFVNAFDADAVPFTIAVEVVHAGHNIKLPGF